MFRWVRATMKYNPRVNEFVARLDGIATEASLSTAGAFTGLLKVLQLLEKLLEITGWMQLRCSQRQVAQGELTGLLLIRAHHEKNGNPRKKV